MRDLLYFIWEGVKAVGLGLTILVLTPVKALLGLLKGKR